MTINNFTYIEARVSQIRDLYLDRGQSLVDYPIDCSIEDVSDVLPLIADDLCRSFLSLLQLLISDLLQALDYLCSQFARLLLCQYRDLQLQLLQFVIVQVSV